MRYFYLVLVALIAVGCSSKQELVKEALNSVGDRPEWVMVPPAPEGDQLYFVGTSALYGTEKNARRDAKRDAIREMSEYVRVLNKNKFERASVTYGMDSFVIMPTVSERNFEKIMSASTANYLRVEEMYFEREADAAGVPGYKYFVLTGISKTDLETALHANATANAKDAQTAMDLANTEVAKAQWKNARDFWKELAKDGFVQ
jgi:flavin-binding protein dodecin